jgi:acyl carrier protein
MAQGVSSEVLAHLLSSVRDALQEEDVSEEDRFLELGGDSLSAMMVVASLESFGWSIEIDDLLTDRPLDAVALRARPMAGS